MAEYKYQSKVFTCKKCGIQFEVYSDSAIGTINICNDCNKIKDGKK